MTKKRCEIICVGTELLLGDILNTNAQFLAQGLSELGLDLYLQTVVGDNEARLEQAVYDAMKRAEILLFTGGLGPTADDLTKEVVARCFKRALRADPAALEEIRGYYRLTRRPMPISNEKQALLPEGGLLLKNPQGTAPGCVLYSNEGHIAVLMPGPPREMRPMFRDEVVPLLREYSSGTLLSRVVRVISMGESQMAEILSDLMDTGVNPTLAPYAKDGEAMVRVTARAASREEAMALIEPIIAEINNRLGRHAYGVDVPNLETVNAGLLKQGGLTVSFLEAGSGGLAAFRAQTAEGGSKACGPCLSSGSLKELAAMLGLAKALPEDPALACAILANLACYRLNVPVAAVISLNIPAFACAVSMMKETRQYAGSLPQRGPDYYRIQAVQSAFDLLRLMLLDYLEQK